MTVSTAPTPLTYNGNGSTTAFPITWKYNATSHVVATLRSSAGVETVWVLTTNYTLTAAGDSGTLTAVVAPATGETLVITLEPPNTQSSDIPLGGDLPSTTLEDSLDLSAQRDAKIESLFLRALRVPKTDTQTGSLLELPVDSLRASKFLSFDANGKPIAAAGTSANLKPVSAFVDTLLDDADAATAQRTLSPGVAALTSNTTLGASHYGQFIQVSGASVTLTLSDAATLTAGWNCRIINTDSTNSITIGRATAGDTINGTAANFTLPALHAIDVFVIAAANGFLIRSAVINPVTTDTAQTITGAKTLSNTALIQTSTTANLVIGGNSRSDWRIHGAADANAGAWEPVTDVGVNLGSATQRVGTVFTTNIDSGSGTLILRGAGSTAITITGAGVIGASTLATPVASTSGTFIDFTGIPSGVRTINVMLFNVSTDGVSNMWLQIGDAGGVEITGYESQVSELVGGTIVGPTATQSAYILKISGAATDQLSGLIVLSLENSATNSWVASVSLADSTGSQTYVGAGRKSLSAALDRVRITMQNGTDSFDGGEINISYV